MVIQFRTFLVSFICMLTAFALVQKVHSGKNVEVIEKNIDKFPYKIGNYLARDIKMEDEIIKELNTDVYVFRRYVDKQDQEINLYIGYYGTKKGGRTGHNPNACYPGSGWSIINKSVAEVPVIFDGEGRMITLNSLHVKKDDSIGNLVYHWYQSNGDVVLSSGVEQNLHRFKSKILYKRNDGAFIRVSSPVTQSLYATENRVKDFIKQIFPLIVKHWPEEKEI